MIVDCLEKINRYQGIHPNLDTAIDFLLDQDLSTLPMGRTSIDGEKVYVNVVDGVTSCPKAGVYEYHKRYIDIHLDLSGAEILAVSVGAPVDIEEFDEVNDGGLCKACGPEHRISLGNNVFVLVFPWEAHQPLITAGASASVFKCIFKVLVD